MKLGKLWRTRVRRYIARPGLQPVFRALYRFALAGMNYGGAGSETTSGDDLGLVQLARLGISEPTIFDVGANEGGYLVRALDAAPRGRIFSFEPSRTAYAQLERAFGTRPNVTLIRTGVGAKTMPATLWSSAPGSVLASTFANPELGPVTGEPIDIVSLDEFCAAREIKSIDLLKIDVEGGELDVLRGARNLLNARAISIIQFEFGQPSLGSRTYFNDLFRMLEVDFRLYRVLPNAVVELGNYHETLEIFMSTNYLAVKRP